MRSVIKQPDQVKGYYSRTGDLKPQISKSVRAVLHRVSDGPYTVGGRKALIKVRALARKALEQFQRRCRHPVELLVCNGEFWLERQGISWAERGKFKKLCEALDSMANPLRPGIQRWVPDKNNPRWMGGTSRERWNFECRIMQRFPELCTLWRIAYELDSAPGRPGINCMKPRSKPWKPNKSKTGPTVKAGGG